MKRTILHVDLNNFYASVECLYRPELRDKPSLSAAMPRRCITIGDLAKREPDCLRRLLGAWGETLWHFDNGSDITAVKRFGRRKHRSIHWQ